VLSQSALGCGLIPSRMNGSVAKCYAEMAGDAKPAAPCPILRFITNNFAVDLGMTPTRT
jgi:hypothetical protein